MMLHTEVTVNPLTILVYCQRREPLAAQNVWQLQKQGLSQEAAGKTQEEVRLETAEAKVGK